MSANSPSKLPNTVTTEDLLNTLEATKNEEVLKIDDQTNDIVLFLTSYNIKPGRQPVKKHLLYQLYIHWSPKPLSRAAFAYNVGKFLLHHQIGPNQFYKINLNAFNINAHLYKLLLEKTRDKLKSPRHQKHFENFIKHYDIKGGDKCWVESFVLYYLYDKWAYSINKPNPLGERQFFNFCTVFFKHKRITESNIQWFGVQKKLLKQLTRGELSEVRKGYYEANKRKRKEKKDIKEERITKK